MSCVGSTADVIADRRTHLPWLVSRSVVDTLYWTETVTTSRLNVVDDVDDVCVLVWLVEYSRGVVYVTELMSVKTEEKNVRQGVVLYLVISHPRRGHDPGRWGRGMKRVERHGSKRDGRDMKCGGGTIFTRA